MSHDPQRPRIWRRTFVVDKEWQLTVFRNFAALAVGAALVQMLGTFVLTNGDLLQEWSSEQIGRAAMAVNGIFLVLVFLAVWIVSLRITHAVAGPARVIRAAVDGLRRDEFGAQLSLRRGDYLKELAGSVEALSVHLEQRASTLESIEAALLCGATDEALASVRQLRAESPSGAEEEVRCVA